MSSMGARAGSHPSSSRVRIRHRGDTWEMQRQANFSHFRQVNDSSLHVCTKVPLRCPRPLNDPRAVKLVKKRNRVMLVAKTSRPELARMFELLDRRSIPRLDRRADGGDSPFLLIAPY